MCLRHLMRLRLRVDLEADGVLGWNACSDRYRFDGDLKLCARCYRLVALECKPWLFLGWLIENLAVLPKAFLQNNL